MQVSAVSNRIPQIDPDAEAHGAVKRLIAIVFWDLLFNLYSALHRPVDAVEYNQQEVATRLDDLATVLVNCRIY